MKAHFKYSGDSKAIHRIKNGLISWSSDIEWVDDDNDAELVIIPVVGRLEHLKRYTAYLRVNGKKYALIQLVLKSTMEPDEEAWWPVWTHAELVWSYYRLNSIKNFYHAPLGVDNSVFFDRENEKTNLICTVGPSYLTESVRECIIAAKDIGQSIHVGANLPQTKSFVDIDDFALASIYSSSLFVSGLRRCEGFELPAAEGLLCGARPILFDQPHYRDWYGDLAEYIPETPREGVIENLKELFKKPYRAVTEEEIKQGMTQFNWKPIVEGFWTKLWEHSTTS